MRRIKRVRPVLHVTLGLLALLAAAPHPPRTEAGGPIAVTPFGSPFVWRRSRVPFTPDQGTLGSASNSQAIALVADAFQVWEDVPTSRVRFRQEGQLDQDITAKNVMAFLDQVVQDCFSGQGCVSPVIFDTNGRIIDAILGSGSSRQVIGFASPILRSDGVIPVAYAVLNGRFPLDVLRGTAVHEFGHYIGLDHTQLNPAAAFDFDKSNDATVPTMFPFIVDGSESLHIDDEAAVSALYPDFQKLLSLGSIAGRVLLPDGTGFQGANVIARNVHDPELTAVTSVSGFLHTGSKGGMDLGSDDPELLGFYEIPGLPPGRYTVEIEEILFEFTEGSSVGPLDPPAELPGPPEFYNGDEESNSDDPDRKTEIDVTAGTRVEGIDIILNVAQMTSETRISARGQE